MFSTDRKWGITQDQKQKVEIYSLFNPKIKLLCKVVFDLVAQFFYSALQATNFQIYILKAICLVVSVLFLTKPIFEMQT